MSERVCRFCERSVKVNPLTGGLRWHKISDAMWRRISPLPNMDGRCPGAGSTN